MNEKSVSILTCLSYDCHPHNIFLDASHSPFYYISVSRQRQNWASAKVFLCEQNCFLQCCSTTYTKQHCFNKQDYNP